MYAPIAKQHPGNDDRVEESREEMKDKEDTEDKEIEEENQVEAPTMHRLKKRNVKINTTWKTFRLD